MFRTVSNIHPRRVTQLKDECLEDLVYSRKNGLREWVESLQKRLEKLVELERKVLRLPAVDGCLIVECDADA